MAISKEKRDKIVAQALNEMSFARRYKQGKIKNWQKNEALYYGNKETAVESRANVDLHRMQEFVHGWLSKLDAPLVFKYTKRKMAQLKRVARLNALRAIDAHTDNWDIKDLAGKKQAAIYGRCVNSYYADSIDGEYCSHNDNVDVYDFLIDPAAGGLDIDKARYLGDYGVVLDKTELRQGVRAGIYIKSVVDTLIDGSGNAGEETQEETNKKARAYDTKTTASSKESETDGEKFKFWRWGTTYEGERYYLVLSETGACAIRVVKLLDLVSATREAPRGPWWYWSWAPYPDLTEFWTPAPCDYVREIFMAQAVSINQMLDNAEEINKPQTAVDVDAIEDLSQLKYRRGGKIHFKGAEYPNFDVNRAIQQLRPPSIKTPIDVFNILEDIQSKSSGVNAGTEGVEKVNGKVGIYKGNQENSADRFGLVNRGYAFGYKRLAMLYELGVRDNLNKRVAIDMIGPDGVEMEMVSRRDIFHKDDKFGVMVEASNAEEQTSELESERKSNFLMAAATPNSPFAAIQNPKKAYEIAAKVAGFDADTIKELLDTSEYGSAEILSEADRDIESLLDGKAIRPNKNANIAYKQRVVDYLNDHEEDISHQQFLRIANYLTALEPIIMANFVREMNESIQKRQMKMMEEGGAPAGAGNIDPTQGGGAPGQDLPITPATNGNDVPVPAVAA